MTKKSVFKAYVTNLGAYNEGILFGEWLSFPYQQEELDSLLKRIGIGSVDEFGCPYEEIFITDYDSEMIDCWSFGEYENLDDLNEFAEKVANLKGFELEIFEAITEAGAETDLYEAVEKVDDYILLSGINDHESLGRYYAENLLYDELIPGSLAEKYFDYEAYGRDIFLSTTSYFTDRGYLEHIG